MVNPVINGANAFLAIWSAVPQPIKGVFYVALIFAVIWTLFQLITR